MNEFAPPGQVELPSVTNIAEHGDLILIVGPDKKQIRVHSAFLKETSEVFARMLSDTWKDPNVNTVELEDDDAGAMIKICYALHHKYDKLERTLRPSEMLEIGILADKYFLFTVLKCVAARYWFGQGYFQMVCSVKDQGCFEMMQLATIAQRFDSTVAFREITRKLICDWSGSYIAHDEVYPAIPMDENLPVILEAKRANMKLKIAELLGDPCYSRKWSAKHAANWLRVLRDRGIKPTSSMPISDTVQKFRGIRLSGTSWASKRVFNGTEVRMNDERKQDCIRILKDMIDRGGLCLFSFKQGRWY